MTRRTRRRRRRRQEEAEEAEQEEEEATDIKSNNPHLAGGEKSQQLGRLGVKCPLKSLNFKGKLINHPENPIDDSITGWWYTYPSEKYGKS